MARVSVALGVRSIVEGGAGIAIEYDSSPTVFTCTFENNSAAVEAAFRSGEPEYTYSQDGRSYWIDLNRARLHGGRS